MKEEIIESIINKLSESAKNSREWTPEYMISLNHQLKAELFAKRFSLKKEEVIENCTEAILRYKNQLNVKNEINDMEKDINTEIISEIDFDSALTAYELIISS